MSIAIQSIKDSILATLPNGSHVVVLDPQQDGQHFEALVISSAFEDLSLVKQHQVVMNALKDAFATSVHALSLNTFSPSQWESAKSRFAPALWP